MNNEDLLDGLHVIARRRGQKIQQGDVEFIEAAIKALAKPAPRPEVVPTGRIEIRTNVDATLDEAILTYGKAHFHLEQMDDGHWWMALTLDKQRVDINLTARGRIKAMVSDEGEVKLIDDASASPLPQPKP